MINITGFVTKLILHTSIAALVFGGTALARMEAVTDNDLDTVYARHLFSISVLVKDISFSYSLDNYAYRDTDTGNKLEFGLVNYHNGSGGPVFFDSGVEPITFDTFTINNPPSPAHGKTYFAVNIPEWHQDYHISVENLIFCDIDLGSLDMGNFNSPFSSFFLSLRL